MSAPTPHKMAARWCAYLAVFAGLSLCSSCDTKKDTRPPEQLWKEVCSTCHGMSGEGLRHKLGKSIDMRSELWQATYSDEELAEIIREGKAGARRMPAFGKKLDDDQINGLVSYLREQIGGIEPEAKPE